MGQMGLAVVYIAPLRSPIPMIRGDGAIVFVLEIHTFRDRGLCCFLLLLLIFTSIAEVFSPDEGEQRRARVLHSMHHGCRMPRLMRRRGQLLCGASHLAPLRRLVVTENKLIAQCRGALEHLMHPIPPGCADKETTALAHTSRHIGAISDSGGNFDSSVVKLFISKLADIDA